MSTLPMRLILISALAAGAGLILGCAAEGRPTGGPADTEGPRVIQVEPPSGTLALAPERAIEITFHEPVDPLSVAGAIEFRPRLAFSARVRGRRIIIQPDEPFQLDAVYILTLQRGIQDYRRNPITRAYQFVFSTGGEIPTGLITGIVAEADPGRPMEAGLFRLTGEAGRVDMDDAVSNAVDDGAAEASGAGRSDYVLLQRQQLAADGSFAFAYLEDDTYRIAAVEGGLADLPAAIHHRRYALTPTDSLPVKGDTVAVGLRRSAPLAEPQILSAEWVTRGYLYLTFDGPFGEVPLPENVYPTGEAAVFHYVLPEPHTQDTLLIDLGTGLNALGETYPLTPFALAVTELQDTIRPALTPPGGSIELQTAAPGAGGPFGAARGRIAFTEPVWLGAGITARVVPADTLAGAGLDLPLRQVSPFLLELEIPQPERYDQVLIDGGEITDQAGNALADSVVVIRLAFTPPAATGSILGTISGLPGPQKRVVVEARQADSGQRVVFTVSDSARFRMDGVPPGSYTVWGHEQVGEFPVPYYSGRWEPYQRSARFAFHSQVIEVRPRWEVDGIDINFRARTQAPP
ncbi:MAG: Ig-like domain-containing protein [Candidatus Neomarinimicrobiota bacterium]